MSLIDEFKKRRRRFMKYFGGWALRRMESIVKGASIYANTPFYDLKDFPWIKDLEADWDIIRQEAEYVVNLRDKVPAFQDISTDQKSINQDNQWKTFFLYGMGLKNDICCNICPETTRLVEKVPGMKTAFFSILLPGKEIPEHRGIFNAVLRYHLGLIIPEPMEGCGIKVDGETRHWKPGESMMFDDTYDHSAWNRTDGIRVILFMDIMRPMKRPWNTIFELAIKGITKTGYVQDAKKNMAAWAPRLEDVPPAPVKKAETAIA